MITCNGYVTALYEATTDTTILVPCNVFTKKKNKNSFEHIYI